MRMVHCSPEGDDSGKGSTSYFEFERFIQSFHS